MSPQDSESAKVPMRPTRQVAVSNASGGATNGMIVAFLMFGLGRYYGGQDMIPGDVLQIMPYVVVLIGVATHSATEWFTRDRHVAASEPEPGA